VDTVTASIELPNSSNIFAPVAIKLGLVRPTILIGHFLVGAVFAVQSVRINVADSNDVAAGDEGMCRVAVTFSTHADAGDVESVIRAEDASDEREGEGSGPGGKRGAPDKRAAVKQVIWVFLFHNYSFLYHAAGK